MSLKHIFLRGTGYVIGLLAGLLTPFAAVAQGGGDIQLLECIGGVCSLPTAGQSGFGVFFAYFNLLYPWVVGLGAAIAVMMGLVGGIEIMTAGANDGQRSKGINRLLLSTGGLIILLLSPTILNMLNPTFFK